MGAPAYKVDSTKRVVKETMASPSLSVCEKFAYLLGMRSMARITAGEESGVHRLMQKFIDDGVHRTPEHSDEGVHREG